MRGQKVIVRALDGQPAVRLIWDYDTAGVQVVPEKKFKMLLEGGDHRCFPWFVVQDVYVFEPAGFAALADKFSKGDEPNWNSVPHWRATEESQ